MEDLLVFRYLSPSTFLSIWNNDIFQLRALCWHNEGVFREEQPNRFSHYFDVHRYDLHRWSSTEHRRGHCLPDLPSEQMVEATQQPDRTLRFLPRTCYWLLLSDGFILRRALVLQLREPGGRLPPPLPGLRSQLHAVLLVNLHSLLLADRLLRETETSTLIGPDQSRYCALIGRTLMCWC